MPDALLKARRTLRYSQEDFSAELGLSRRTLTRWETGETMPDDSELGWVVSKTHALGEEAGEQLAKELGLPSPAPKKEALDEVLDLAAAQLDVTPARLRTVLAALVRRWGELGARPVQIVTVLAGKKKG